MQRLKQRTRNTQSCPCSFSCVRVLQQRPRLNLTPACPQSSAHVCKTIRSPQWPPMCLWNSSHASVKTFELLRQTSHRLYDCVSQKVSMNTNQPTGYFTQFISSAAHSAKIGNMLCNTKCIHSDSCVLKPNIWQNWWHTWQDKLWTHLSSSVILFLSRCYSTWMLYLSLSLVILLPVHGTLIQKTIVQ